MFRVFSLSLSKVARFEGRGGHPLWHNLGMLGFWTEVVPSSASQSLEASLNRWNRTLFVFGGQRIRVDIESGDLPTKVLGVEIIGKGLPSLIFVQPI